MIVELLLNLISAVLKPVFSFINLPSFPENLASSINTELDLIFDNASFVGFFVRPSTLSVVATIAITVITFSRLYKVVVWIWNKLPISSS